jgi:hypothetical protein
MFKAGEGVKKTFLTVKNTNQSDCSDGHTRINNPAFAGLGSQRLIYSDFLDFLYLHPLPNLSGLKKIFKEDI